MIKTKVLFSEAARVLALLAAEGCVRQNAADRTREFGFFAGGDQRSAIVGHDFRVSANGISDHGQGRRHRLENNVREAFGVGGEHSNIGRGEDGWNILTIAEEDDAPGEAERRGLLLEFGAQRPVADQQKFRLRQLLANFGSDAQKAGVVFVVRIHARDHRDARCGATRQRGCHRLKYRAGHGITDDGEFFARDSRRGKRSAAACELQTTASHHRNAAACARNCVGVRRSPSWRWLPMTTGVRARRADGIRVRFV